MIWGPSRLGQRITKCRSWRLTILDDSLAFSIDDDVAEISIAGITDVTSTPGFAWSTVEIAHPDRRIRLRGIPKRRARSLTKQLRDARALVAHQLHVAALTAQFEATLQALQQWKTALGDAMSEALEKDGWLTREFHAEWSARKQSLGMDQLLADPTLSSEILRPEHSWPLQPWFEDLGDLIAGANEVHLDAQRKIHHEFFQTVEKSPLTDEQTRAVITHDNRVLVVASAGSGKTSTMVAKAGYAIKRQLVDPDKILLLAFNASAAAELQERVNARLTPQGLDPSEVVARTFHAFALTVIGHATGRKPTAAQWLSNGEDIRQLSRIVDKLRRTDHSFRTSWDFFQSVLARDYVKSNTSHKQDIEDGPNLRTAKGELVKSVGERIIADWLYFNGVDYIYERRYPIATADADHRQYQPDFYYPQIDAFHEHWALNSDGTSDFPGYIEGIDWKRGLHRSNGTILLETTMAQLWAGEALPALAKDLTERGITLDPNPQRFVTNKTPVENEQLLRTFRSFLSHAKSNRLSDEHLEARLLGDGDDAVRFRDRAFLRLFTAIRREWEAALRAASAVDFEDMLNLAVDHLEAGDWMSPFELVMVDEFQDASLARVRMAKALVNQPGRHLLAVGDDWQSINRFAGADLSAMTRFEDHYGPSQILKLERTFRFPQSIADVSSMFVLQNSDQLPKSVRSTTQEVAESVRIMTLDGANRTTAETAERAAIRYFLKTLHDDLRAGTVPRPSGRKIRVYVLGRYQYQKQLLPDWRDLSEQMDVRFMTVHASKGGEADYVVIPDLISGTWGFPSTIQDDPVLRLAMPAPEAFPYAEERRLFYVAMTRARRQALLLTITGRESRFVLELIRDSGIARTNAIGEPLETTVCPECGRGIMTRRNSKRGEFLGCSRYPWCKTTAPLPELQVATRSQRGSWVETGVGSRRTSRR
ncbi:UvrD-helicase domain-containing protein [Leifsonia poae]|uniref:UvrD-helicase domain-containing protein n=1 Tax=Leifsonia poae TaxID=110933 RepID=UPI003D665B4A